LVVAPSPGKLEQKKTYLLVKPSLQFLLTEKGFSVEVVQIRFSPSPNKIEEIRNYRTSGTGKFAGLNDFSSTA